MTTNVEDPAFGALVGEDADKIKAASRDAINSQTRSERNLKEHRPPKENAFSQRLGEPA